MMMAVVMATVRSVQPEKGSVLDLPFLPLANFAPLPEVDHGDITQLCRRVEKASSPEHFVPFYEQYAHLCYMIWARVRAEYLHSDPSLDYAYLPSQMTQNHLEYVAKYMRVCIHVLCYEAMGKETMRYGYKRGMLHLYIYKQDAHYHPVYKVHNLPAQKGCSRAAANWCDFCCITVGTSGAVGKAHMLKCCTKACETPATTLEREFLTKWNNKHQPAFRFPPKNYLRQDKFCVLCNQFMDGLTHDDVEPPTQTEESEVLTEPEVLTEQEESKGTEEELLDYPGGQTEYPEYPIEDACPMCGITLHSLYITHCTVCNVKVGEST
jgi:hypothetical protein